MLLPDLECHVWDTQWTDEYLRTKPMWKAVQQENKKIPAQISDITVQTENYS
jgi:hypothetical protein